MIKLKLMPNDHCDWDVGGIMLKHEIIDWLIENDISYIYYHASEESWDKPEDFVSEKASPLVLVIEFHTEEEAVLFKLKWL